MRDPSSGSLGLLGSSSRLALPPPVLSRWTSLAALPPPSRTRCLSVRPSPRLVCRACESLKPRVHRLQLRLRHRRLSHARLAPAAGRLPRGRSGGGSQRRVRRRSHGASDHSALAWPPAARSSRRKLTPSAPGVAQPRGGQRREAGGPVGRDVGGARPSQFSSTAHRFFGSRSPLRCLGRLTPRRW